MFYIVVMQFFTLIMPGKLPLLVSEKQFSIRLGTASGIILSGISTKTEAVNCMDYRPNRVVYIQKYAEYHML